MLNRFFDYLRLERNSSERTLITYRDCLEKFQAFWSSREGELSWENMPSDVIRAWVVEMMDDGLKAATVSKCLSAVKAFYRYMLRMGYVDKDPARLIKAPKRERTLPGFISESEMDRLFEQVQFTPDYNGQRDRLLLLMLYTTGLRASELIGLNVEDVDTDQCQLKVTGKRNKQRIIPFGKELADTLHCYMERRDKEITRLTDGLFLNRKGRRVSNQQVRKLVEDNLAKVTTMKKRSPHVLRHTFATAMLNHNAELESVSRLLGHASIATTEIYTHTTFEQLKREYQSAHPRA